jgi:hypothetical protein
MLVSEVSFFCFKIFLKASQDKRVNFTIVVAVEAVEAGDHLDGGVGGQIVVVGGGEGGGEGVVVGGVVVVGFGFGGTVFGDEGLGGVFGSARRGRGASCTRS